MTATPLAPPAPAPSAARDARDVITGVKAAVIRQFEALDARLDIHSTGYFNHSFVPDLVLRWPGSAPRPERQVFLRGGADGGCLAEDVARLGGESPILLSLEPLAALRRAPEGRELAARAVAAQTLVADVTAIGSVVAAARQRPVAALLATGLAQGGRGVLDDAAARAGAGAVTDGFDGARAMRAEGVLQAAQILDDLLTGPFAQRFSRLFQAVWIGSGGRADLFPARRELTVGVDDETLEFLLGLDPIDDDGFWRRLGRSTSVRQLGRLSLTQPSDNLQRLIKANLDHLWARACRVQEWQPRLDEQDLPPLWWCAEQGALALRFFSWTAFVAEKAEDIEHIAGGHAALSVDDLRSRSADVVLSGLHLSDGREELDWSSRVNANIVASDRLATLVASFGAGARVQRATARSGSRQLTCDFAKSSVTTPTRSAMRLSDLLRVALPLLRPLADGERALLAETLRPLPEHAPLLPEHGPAPLRASGPGGAEAQGEDRRR